MIFFLILALLLQPITVPIQNPSFEQSPSGVMSTGRCYDAFFARSGYPDEMPPGWVRTYRNPTWGQTVVIRPFPSNACGIPAPPDGSWILYVASSTVAQDTGVKPSSFQQPGVSASDGLYVMKFWVANYFTVYPGYYEAKINFGTHELCSTDGYATQRFTQVSLVCPSPNYLLGQWPDGSAVDPNAHIVISLGTGDQTGWPLLFDDVSLTFTEQP